MRLGRAVSQLAGLLGPSLFSLCSKSLVWPSATAIHPSARFNRAALAMVCYEFSAKPAIFLRA
nr:hypothetical protein [Saprospira grandis]